jgi:urease accessory protein
VAGRLDLEFATDAHRRTYLRRQYAGYPFHVCRALYQDQNLPGLTTVYIQSCSGGVYEDDRLDMTLSAVEGAEAHVSTQAATVVHSMPAGSAKLSVRIQGDSGSYLEYLPDPQILFPDSRCESEIAVRLSGNAIAVVSDSFLRHDPAGKDEVFSTYSSEIVIEHAAGNALAIDRLKADGQDFRRACPGLSGSFGAQGTLIVAGLDFASRAIADELHKIKLDRQEVVIGSSQLPTSAGILVRMMATDGVALRRAMHMVWCAIRFSLKGSLPAARRK